MIVLTFQKQNMLLFDCISVPFIINKT